MEKYILLILWCSNLMACAQYYNPYPNNPFVPNGNYNIPSQSPTQQGNYAPIQQQQQFPQPAIQQAYVPPLNVQSAPIEAIKLPPTTAPPPYNPLRKYCLKPIGQFPGRACNIFVNCWNDGVVEQFCPPSLVFNPAGYCDYPEFVDCKGKPIIPFVQTSGSNDGSWKPDPVINPPVSYPSYYPTTKKPIDHTITLSPIEQPTKKPLYPSYPSYYPTTKKPIDHTITLSPIEQPTKKPTTTEPPFTIRPIPYPPSYGPQKPPVSSVTQKPIPIVPPSYVPQNPVTAPQNINNQIPQNTGGQSSGNLKQLCRKPRGQFPSYSCNKYVNCWDDVVIEQECPSGLLFSEKGYCDFPYNVDCKNRIRPAPARISKLCQLPHGTFRDAYNCSVYYTCIGGEVAGTFVCPDGLKFNELIGICDYDYNVNCNTYIPNPREHQEILQRVHSSLVDPVTGCLPGTVVRMNPECSIASLCKSGHIEVVHCPNGLAYDSKTDKCIPKHLANC